jgi:hypothetical protein
MHIAAIPAVVNRPESRHKPQKGSSMFNRSSRFFWLTVASLVVAVSLPAQTFSPWSKVESLGALVNSTVSDSCLFVTPSGLSLYFASTRPGGSGALDLYVSRRASRNAPWGEPKSIGATLNTPGNDHLPYITPDGHTMYFASDRAGGLGFNDIYSSFRRNAADDFGWEAPVRIAELSSSRDDYAPWGFVDAATGGFTLYFATDRDAATGLYDIFSSALQADGQFTAPAPVAELNTSVMDSLPTIRADGLELYLTSTRPGGLGSFDIWASTRASTAEPWPAPVNLGAPINTTVGENRAQTMGSDTDLYFFSGRPGGLGASDLYHATRTRTTIIPVARSTRGTNGVVRTSAQFSNPSDTEISGTIVFHPAGAVASADDPRTSYLLAPYESQSRKDVLANIGVSGLGSLEIIPESGPAPASLFRIQNGASSVIVPAVGEDNLMAGGAQSAVKVPSDMTGLRLEVGVRTFDAGATIWFCHHTADGTYLGGLSRVFPPNSLLQVSAAEMLGVGVNEDEMMMYTIQAGSAVIYVSTAEKNGPAGTLQVVRPFRN